MCFDTIEVLGTGKLANACLEAPAWLGDLNLEEELATDVVGLALALLVRLAARPYLDFASVLIVIRRCVIALCLPKIDASAPRM